jgi:hypothetical protein
MFEELVYKYPPERSDGNLINTRSKTADMEYLYHSYTKLIDDQIHYFVKKILTFPEFTGVTDVQVGYGMHTDFEKACNICGINDSACRKQILLELTQRNLPRFPKRQHSMHTTRPQRPGEQLPVQITEMVNRWLVERGAEALN